MIQGIVNQFNQIYSNSEHINNKVVLVKGYHNNQVIPIVISGFCVTRQIGPFNQKLKKNYSRSYGSSNTQLEVVVITRSSCVTVVDIRYTVYII